MKSGIFAATLLSQGLGASAAVAWSLRAAMAEPVVEKVVMRRDLRTGPSTSPEPRAIAPGGRLDMEGCQEPTGPGYETYSGSFGPDKIKCCRTGNEAVEKLEKRCQDCHDAVPCSQDMEEKFCPEALQRYKEMRDEVCKPLPTTTSTTTKSASTTTAKRSTNTTPSADTGGNGTAATDSAQLNGTAEDSAATGGNGTATNDGAQLNGTAADSTANSTGNKTIAKTATNVAKAKAEEPEREADHGDALSWCYRLCRDLAQGESCKDEAKCKHFCQEAGPRFAEMRKV